MECPQCGDQFILGDDTCSNCNGDLTQIPLPKPKSGAIHEMILRDPISQLNAPEPILLKKTDTVATAVQLMRKLRFGSVLVVEDRRLVGIFTEHDLVRHFACRESELATRTLGEVMTPNPRYLREEDTLAHALNSMAVGGYRHIPVVEGDRPKGFISIRGILAYLVENTLS